MIFWEGLSPSVLEFEFYLLSFLTEFVDQEVVLNGIPVTCWCKVYFTFYDSIISTSLLPGWIPCHFKKAAITGLLKKLAPAAKDPINYRSISNLAFLVLREGACKRVAERLPSHLCYNLLSETVQWIQCSAKGSRWPWWVFSTLFCWLFC